MKKVNIENKLLEKIVEYSIKCMIDWLKDDVKSRAVFIIDKSKFRMSDEKGGLLRARVEYLTKPPIVRFYLSAIAYTHLVHIFEDLQKLMRHEIAHVLGIRDEKGANQNDRRLNIFKKVL